MALYAAATLASLGFISASKAAPLFTDGFETYTAGGASLDKNGGGANAAPNGSGNPWWGPAAPNFYVVGTEGGVNPLGGTKMVRGFGQAGAANQIWYNAAYRNNAGQPYHSNVILDFAFYDPNGSGASANAYQDFGALAYYSDAPAGSDYPASQTLNASATSQRVGVGASNDTNGTYDPTKYQIQISGLSGGYDPGSGWFNTSLTRSIGWHAGRIEIDTVAANGIKLYIDNLATPVFTSGLSSGQSSLGFNTVELDGSWGDTRGYFDNVGLSLVPEPTSLAMLAAGGALLLRSRRRK
jgi:hypothetical protein